MCTAATLKTKDFYMGRTLDYECSYGEEITVTPRNFVFSFRNGSRLPAHYAIIGVAHVAENYPLYYDAVNEKGLGIAGLNFVGNACYQEPQEGSDSIAQFELIPWILARCESVVQAKELLSHTILTNTPFSEDIPPAELHWLIADAKEAITLEVTRDGMHLYPNPLGVLTNNPPFDTQMFLLNQYQRLSPAQPKNLFCPDLDLTCYSRGMGTIGLPGDLSSPSRFVRAAFTGLHSVSGSLEGESVSQFFHILGSVEQVRGCCEVSPGQYEVSIYTSCCNATKGIYYYKTYDNHRICAVDMHRENLDGDALIRYPLLQENAFFYQN